MQTRGAHLEFQALIPFKAFKIWTTLTSTYHRKRGKVENMKDKG